MEKSNFIVLDSSVLCSANLPNDVNNLKALELLSGISTDYKIILPPLCIFEVAATLAKNKIDKDLIFDFINKIIKENNVLVLNLNDMHFLKNIEMFYTESNIRTHDFYILQTAMAFDATLFTFDRKLLTEGRKIYKNIFDKNSL